VKAEKRSRECERQKKSRRERRKKGKGAGAVSLHYNLVSLMPKNLPHLMNHHFPFFSTNLFVQ